MAYKDKTEFIQRMGIVLQDRKKTPWGRALGLADGTVTRMFNDEAPLPAAAELRLIMWSENTALSWLCEGKGKPFFVGVSNTGKELCDAVSDHLEDTPDASIDIFHDEIGTIAVILTTPAQRQYKNDVMVDYTAIEVEVGPASNRLKQLLTNYTNQISCSRIGSDTMKKIREGQLGTYALLVLRSGDDSFDNVFKNVEDDGKSNAYMRLAIQMVEEAIIEDGSYLDPAQKAKVITAIYNHCQEQKIELTPEVVRLLIDAA